MARLQMKIRKYLQFRSPMQVPSHGQWWSSFSMQQLQILQWFDLGGLQISQCWQCLVMLRCAPKTDRYYCWSLPFWNGLSNLLKLALYRKWRIGMVAGSVLTVRIPETIAEICTAMPMYVTHTIHGYFFIRHETVFNSNKLWMTFDNKIVPSGYHKLTPN